ncbi:MAG: hypothetical protein ACK56I_13300, partial [bacterium]
MIIDDQNVFCLAEFNKVQAHNLVAHHQVDWLALHDHRPSNQFSCIGARNQKITLLDNRLRSGLGARHDLFICFGAKLIPGDSAELEDSPFIALTGRFECLWPSACARGLHTSAKG